MRTIILIIYILGYIASLVMLIYTEREDRDVTLGDAFFFAFISLFSWGGIGAYLIFIVLDCDKVVFKKKNKKNKRN